MLITFEGIDGAGKSTQIKKLLAFFAEQQLEVLSLREPGGTEVAEKIREILLESHHEITPIGELLLFSASRIELVQKVIMPALNAGQTVILDRFFDSTTAYQGYGRGIDLEQLHSIISLSTGGLKPDITFYLDLLPEEAMQRKFFASSLPLAFEDERLDRMERSGLDFFKKVRQGYHAIMQSNPERFVALDATEAPDKIHCKIIRILKDRYPG